MTPLCSARPRFALPSDLSAYTTLRVGGPARLLIDGNEHEGLVNTMREVWASGEPWMVLGGGSNVVIGDDGFDGTVVRITDQFGPSRAIYIYDGYVQLWMRIDALGLNDEAPLSQRDADGLAAILAVRMSDEFGSELLTAGTVQAANKYKMALVTGYGSQEREAW